jgi:hypothetical protein
MIQTFQFRTEAVDNTYYHTVYSVDVKTAVDKWIRQIEDLQNEVYSFNPDQVQTIKQQYLNGQLQVHVYKEPYFLTYQTFDKHQIVHIDKVNKGEPGFYCKSYLPDI